MNFSAGSFASLLSLSASGKKRSGFSLLEILMMIIVSSILGTILYSYMNTALLHGDNAPSKLQRIYDLQTVMENITAHYDEIKGKNTWPQWEPSHAYLVGDTVVSSAEPFGHIYTCVTAGSSDSTEPLWLTTDGAVIADGTTVKWKESGGELDDLFEKVSTFLIPPVPPLPTQDAVWDYAYGKYGLIQKEFIRFESGVETPVLPSQPEKPENLLKISIRNEDGYRLTSLFSTSY